MRPVLLLLPLLSLLALGIGLGLKGAYPHINWIPIICWATAGAVVVLWVSLEWDRIVRAFSRKGAKYGASSGLVVILGVLLILLLGVLSERNRFAFSWDVTRTSVNTLADQSLSVLRLVSKRDLDVEIIAFFDDEQIEASFRDLISLYQHRSANLSVEYVDSRRSRFRAEQEGIESGNTVIVRTNGQESRVTTFSEERLTNALVGVLRERAKKIYFTTGHGEGGLDDQDLAGFNRLKEALESSRYEVASVSLLEAGRVPDDAELLVIAGPRYEFSEQAVAMIDRYLQRGGALLVMQGALLPIERLNQLLVNYGLRFENDLLALHPEDHRAALFGEDTAIVSEFDRLSSLTRAFAYGGQVALISRLSRSVVQLQDNHHRAHVELVGFVAPAIFQYPNVKSSEDLRQYAVNQLRQGRFAMIATAAVQFDKKTRVAALESFDEQPRSDVVANGGDEDSSETRIVAIGASQIAHNAGASANAANLDMIVNAANYLTRDEEFISIRPRDVQESRLDIVAPGSQFALFFISFIYPFLFLGGGVFYWAQRRRA